MNERYEITKIVHPRKGWAVVDTAGGRRQVVGPIYARKGDALAALAEVSA